MEITKRSRCSLEEDLIVEILSRLPVKSLMRFRCVSKEWNSLTRNSNLISIHLRRSDSNLSLLTYTTHRDDPKLGISMLGDEAADLVSIDLSFLNNYTCSESVKIVGSSNGLVCLVTEGHKNVAKHMDGVEIIIWNPATRQYRTIPKPVLAESINYRPGLAEHINYRLGTPTFGFGFSDHNTNDYKLVGIFRNQVQVFTRSTNSWRQVEVKRFPWPSNKYCCICDWISLNGVLYWMTFAITGEFECSVLSFNLRDEAFDVIPTRINVWNSRLLSWKNSLAYIVGNNEQVWAKANDSDESTGAWTKQFSIDSSGCGYILGIWKDQVLIQSDVTSINNEFELFLYDPKTKTRGKCLPKPEAMNYYHYAALVNYVESLVLV